MSVANGGGAVSSDPVIVVGGGWAGLSAAVELVARGVPVHLLEASETLGGRARSVVVRGAALDNGQHLMLGAYRHTWQLLQRLGVEHTTVLRRVPLDLAWRSSAGEQWRICAPPWPAPLHLAAALLRGEGLTAKERWRALAFSTRLYVTGFRVKRDLAVSAWLERHGQPASLVRKLWEPLCLAALTTPIERASARVYARVLRDAFTRSRADSDVIYIGAPLGVVLPEPAQRYLEAQQAAISLKTRVDALLIDAGAVRAVLADGREIRASGVVLATSPWAARALLANHAPLRGLSDQLAHFDYEPICTVYLQFSADVALGTPMLGLTGTLSQWLLDHCAFGRPGLLAAVVSGDGPHVHWPTAELEARIVAELRALFPAWPAPQSVFTLREKRAAFSCRVGVEILRPSNATAVRGLWLAGDYTQTGYPATLEGAVRSGGDAARACAAARL